MRLNWLTNRVLLSTLGVLFVLQSAAFALSLPLLGGTLLDTVINADSARRVLQVMSDEQIKMHILVTSYLDMPYPFVYALLLAGLTLRCSPSLRAISATPALMIIPFDVFENVLQLQALMGDDRGLALKPAITTGKFTLLGIAILLFLYQLGLAARRRTKTNRA